jgi:hypothetical protein
MVHRALSFPEFLTALQLVAAKKYGDAASLRESGIVARAFNFMDVWRRDESLSRSPRVLAVLCEDPAESAATQTGVPTAPDGGVPTATLTLRGVPNPVLLAGVVESPSRHKQAQSLEVPCRRCLWRRWDAMERSAVQPRAITAGVAMRLFLVSAAVPVVVSAGRLTPHATPARPRLIVDRVCAAAAGRAAVRSTPEASRR